MINSSQPVTPFVKIKVGDFNLTPIPPKYIQDFSYTRETNDAANDFEMSLFDHSAIELENELSKGYEDVEFEYGWLNGPRSEKFRARISDYSLSFEGGGASLQVNGISKIVKSHGSGRSFTYKKDGNPMKIHEIIYNIAEYEGWRIGIVEECKPVYNKEDTEEGESSEESEKTFVQKGESSTKFILNKLKEAAVSKDTGKSGYVLWFDDKMDKTVINFSSPKYGEPNKKYVYRMNAENPNIINFSPNFSGTLMLSQGAGEVESRYVDTLSNDLMYTKRTEEDDKDFVKAERKKMDTEGYRNGIITSSATEDEVNKKLNSLRTRVSEAYGATLEILGDPELKVFETIIVIVLTSEGYIHHTSGIYLVREIKDSIDSGSFTSTLELTRDTSKVGQVKAEGKKAGSLGPERVGGR